MPDLGKKYTCYSCHTKFYDLGKPVPLCPKCGADQRDSDEEPVIPVRSRSRAAAVAPAPVVEEPADEGDFADSEAAPAAADSEDEDEIIATDGPEEEAEDEEEEEY